MCTLKIGCFCEVVPFLYSHLDKSPGEGLAVVSWPAMDEGETGSSNSLTIAKQWIALHGGRIWVEREVGEGAPFYGALPAMT